MAYTQMALKVTYELTKTSCIKCGCMGDFKTDDGEYFIMSGNTNPDPKALTADRVCHCATCAKGCETFNERTDRICFNQVKAELLKNGSEPANKANNALVELGTDWSDPTVQAVVVEAEEAMGSLVHSILNPE